MKKIFQILIITFIFIIGINDVKGANTCTCDSDSGWKLDSTITIDNGQHGAIYDSECNDYLGFKRVKVGNTVEVYICTGEDSEGEPSNNETTLSCNQLDRNACLLRADCSVVSSEDGNTSICVDIVSACNKLSINECGARNDCELQGTSCRKKGTQSTQNGVNNTNDTTTNEKGYTTVSCGLTDDIPAALPKFIHNIVNIIKIAVPVLLVILGMLDLAKAVTSNDEKGMKEAQGKFVKRIIGGIAVFLVVGITQFIFNVIGTNTMNEMASCINCFINGTCVTTDELRLCKIKADNMCETNCSKSTGYAYTACMSACQKANRDQCELKYGGELTSSYACFKCTSDPDRYVWYNKNPGSNSLCTGGYEYVNLSESECKSNSTMNSCYQCKGDSSIYSWTSSAYPDAKCPSGYNSRADKTTKEDCHA